MKIKQFIILVLVMSKLAAQDIPGLILIDATGKHYDRILVNPNTNLSWGKGPLFENKYSSFRFSVCGLSVGWFDPYSKKQFDTHVIQYFDDKGFNKGDDAVYGQDIFHASGSPGVGGPVFYVNGKWERLPTYETTDSIIVEVIDSTSESPKFKVSYLGWKIADDKKIDVIYEVSTKWNQRHVNAKVSIVGDFKGKVGAGLTDMGSSWVPVKNVSAATMYIKSTKKNSYEHLQALHIEPKNFESFEYNEYALSHIAVLKKTDSGNYQYNFLFSSSIDEMPLYKNKNWEDELIYKDPLPAPRLK